MKLLLTSLILLVSLSVSEPISINQNSKIDDSTVLCQNRDHSEGRSVLDGQYFKVIDTGRELLVIETTQAEALTWCEKNGVHF